MSTRLGSGAGPTLTLIAFVLGGVFVACGIAMLVCGAIAVAEDDAVVALVAPGAATLAAGVAAVRSASPMMRRGLTVRPLTGLAAVTSAWVGASVVGSVPFIIAGTFAAPLDAVFEATSGFTTTGSTLLSDIESQPDAILLWRSFSQWLGGIGIVVLVVAIAPSSAPGFQRVFFAETSGVTAERLTPRIVDTAKIIGAIYLILSVAAMIAYALAGMGGFDAVNHAMTTIATSGFSTKDASIAAFDSVAIELIAIAFMVLAGINFAFYWRAIQRKPLLPQAAEVLAFLAILVAAIAVLAVSVELANDAAGVASSLRDAAFTATTLITTTGYVTADFGAWSNFSQVLILVLMSFGACAGSTVGGIKVIRVVLLAKAARQELDREIRPAAVRVLRFGGRVYSEDVRRAVLGFLLVYLLIYAIGALALAASGLDPLTATSAASTALNIVGPGLGEVGATDNFEAVPPFGRVVVCVLMITGRLEVFTVVALLAAIFLRRR